MYTLLKKDMKMVFLEEALFIERNIYIIGVENKVDLIYFPIYINKEYRQADLEFSGLIKQQDLYVGWETVIIYMPGFIE